MECERVREEFVERLTGTLDPSRAAALDQHLAGCAACRAETERMRAIWDELGSLRPAAADRTADRVERLIDARAHRTGIATAGTAATSTPAKPSLIPRAAITTAAIAASLLVGVLVGRRSVESIGGESDAPLASTAAVATAAKQQYLLLLEGPARPTGTMPTAADSAAERALVAEYGAWAGELQRSGALVMAEKLADQPVAIHARDGVITPSRNPAEEVGGFFLIQVADSAEAHRIARECPHLKYGGTVQVRRIEPT